MSENLLTILLFSGAGVVLLALLGLAPALHERRTRRLFEIRNAREDAEEAARLGAGTSALPHPPRPTILDRIVGYLSDSLIWIVVAALLLAVWWLFSYINGASGDLPQ